MDLLKTINFLTPEGGVKMNEALHILNSKCDYDPDGNCKKPDFVLIDATAMPYCDEKSFFPICTNCLMANKNLFKHIIVTPILPNASKIIPTSFTLPPAQNGQINIHVKQAIIYTAMESMALSARTEPQTELWKSEVILIAPLQYSIVCAYGFFCSTGNQNETSNFIAARRFFQALNIMLVPSVFFYLYQSPLPLSFTETEKILRFNEAIPTQFISDTYQAAA